MNNANLSIVLLIILMIVLAPSSQAQIVDIESTTQGFLPPRMSNGQRDSINLTANPNGMIIFNTSTGRLNYYDSSTGSWQGLFPGLHTISPITYFLGLPNGIQTLLDAGETPLNIITAGALTSDFIGLNYAGGIIFYMQGDGTGLVATPPEQYENAFWGCEGTLIGANGTAIGTGNQNTLDIIAGCPFIGTAAIKCADLSIGGYTDWFLPSKDELNEMYLKIGQGASAPNNNIGGFEFAFYWSSSEIDDEHAWLQSFVTGVQSTGGDKSLDPFFRAIRAF